MPSLLPSSARVVLVRPRNPLNIGAAARAMANFGLTDMAVVKPFAPVWRETISAVGAEKVVLSAKLCKGFEEAVEGCSLVLGTTVLRNRHVERDIVRLPDLSDYVRARAAGAGGRVALVFGPEKTGLSSALLERCHAWVVIPTDASTPSMNLSHAVAVCCYELSRSVGDGTIARGGVPAAVPPADADEVERLARQALDLFKASDYLDFLPTPQKLSKIRRALLQWNIRKTDVRLLHGLFRYLMGKLGK
jgi:TrmH family RNA methyltransferase